MIPAIAPLVLFAAAGGGRSAAGAPARDEHRKISARCLERVVRFASDARFFLLGCRRAAVVDWRRRSDRRLSPDHGAAGDRARRAARGPARRPRALPDRSSRRRGMAATSTRRRTDEPENQARTEPGRQSRGGHARRGNGQEAPGDSAALQPKRLEVARRNAKWMEIENDLVPRNRGWLVSASTDAIYQPVRGVVFQPYSVTVIADQGRVVLLRRRRRRPPIPRADPRNLDGAPGEAGKAGAGEGRSEAEASARRMSHTALIRFAPLTTLERVNDDRWKDRGRTMYDPGGLTFAPSKDSVPLLVNHDRRTRDWRRSLTRALGMTPPARGLPPSRRSPRSHAGSGGMRRRRRSATCPWGNEPSVGGCDCPAAWPRDRGERPEPRPRARRAPGAGAVASPNRARHVRRRRLRPPIVPAPARSCCRGTGRRSRDTASARCSECGEHRDRCSEHANLQLVAVSDVRGRGTRGHRGRRRLKALCRRGSVERWRRESSMLTTSTRGSTRAELRTRRKMSTWAIKSPRELSTTGCWEPHDIDVGVSAGDAGCLQIPLRAERSSSPAARSI